MKAYDHKKIEKHWQKEWELKKIYKTETSSKKKKMYVLDMFPYPSGMGLHVGHPRGYIGSDIYARMKRMEGFNVLHPMGYDAFGLPAEQYAIANKIHPRKAVEKNVATFEKQLSIIGLSYDWSRRVNTTDPEYYKWTEWIFLQIYDSYFDKKKNKARPIMELEKIFNKSGNKEVDAVCDNNTQIFSALKWKSFSKLEQQNILMKYRLAYEGYAEVNWCPELGTVLANDEVVDGPNGTLLSERGGYLVEKKSMRQWFMRITAYADRLLTGLDGLDWSSHIKEIQRNWIGKSEGSEFEFKTNIDRSIKVFTTRIDTIFGVTYVVLSPEHPNIGEFLVQAKNMEEVSQYIREVKEKINKKDLSAEKEKTGIELKGIQAINPVNGEEVPVWVGDYVLAGYGTGAVMAVPAHDERDFEFAKKYNLEIKQAIAPIFNGTRDDDRPKPNMPFTDRPAIVAIIKHWKDDTILVLDWKKVAWHTLITGGIEEGQSAEEAARREILEETGYKNLKLVKKLILFHSRFYHTPKGRNQFAHFETFYFELVDGEKELVIKEEQEKHELRWVPKNQVLEQLTPDGQQMLYKYLLKPFAICDEGLLVNSGKFNEMDSEYAKKEITKFLDGKIVSKYKMRDAIFARQRYWGEPIPLIHKKDGLIETIPEKKLPLELPNVKSYEPTGTGESPLASVKSWVNAGYETNTMPGWAGSSWYFLRYTDPKNKKELAGKKVLDYWFGKKNGGVDMYVGGQEHATGHLLYLA